MKKLIIFDMDGVLLDSEKLYMDMNQIFFKNLGAEISIEEHQTFVGISATKMWSYIKEKFNLQNSVDELISLEKELKHKTLRETNLTPTIGVLDFLKYLKVNGHIVTIASSGLKKNIDLILQKLEMGEYFDLIVSGEQVEKGKPDPDIFLKVAKHYERVPEDCIVIEDSTNGVLAAKAANMFCIGYFNPNSGNQDLSKADIIIESFKDLKLYDVIEDIRTCIRIPTSEF
jgi:HAD superfamily hydrolase (TIGR01509 family)